MKIFLHTSTGVAQFPKNIKKFCKKKEREEREEFSVALQKIKNK